MPLTPSCVVWVNMPSSLTGSFLALLCRPTGPCGPCSELYYDFHPERGTAGASLEDDSRFIEFYNLVFMESNRGPDGSLAPLANKNIDTGMGLERVAQVSSFSNSFKVPTGPLEVDKLMRQSYAWSEVRPTHFCPPFYGERAASQANMAVPPEIIVEGRASPQCWEY